MKSAALQIGHETTVSRFTAIPERFRLHRALTQSARAIGERMRSAHEGSWEFRSQDGDHLWSRNDLEATAFFLRYIPDFFSRAGLDVTPTFENEEVPLVPAGPIHDKEVRLIIDPIDGSKSFDNFKWPWDCPIPEPSSAVSIAAVCPILNETVASAVYCFDRGEVFSSISLGRSQNRELEHIALRDNVLLRPLSEFSAGSPPIEAKRRVLNCAYNSRALVEVARLDLALMDHGLKAAYGGLTGSTATDIINVVRGSFAACIDIRALCNQGGSCPFWYDAAGAFPIAIGRGLRVIVTDAQGQPLVGSDHAIRTPVAFIVANPDVAEVAVEAVREVACSAFMAESASVPLVQTTECTSARNVN